MIAKYSMYCLNLHLLNLCHNVLLAQFSVHCTSERRGEAAGAARLSASRGRQLPGQVGPTGTTDPRGGPGGTGPEIETSVTVAEATLQVHHTISAPPVRQPEGPGRSTDIRIECSADHLPYGCPRGESHPVISVWVHRPAGPGRGWSPA